MDASGCYYTVLGVDSSADDAAIRLAYRKLMRRYHPDVNRAEEAAAQAQSINEAYACLKDPDERAAYDRQREAPRSRPRPNFTAGQWSPPRGAGWQPPGPKATIIEIESPPHKIRASILILALIVTFIIFAATSAIPPIEPVPPPTVTIDSKAMPAGEAG
ncbi:J domain-containing protein [Sphingomonas glaciei]|uniref:DnaJ domain-containing protein n=1 Tax=Sphingomonas glaciei TaxID=2938948 RepID=A0ABY5MTQ8_9SPHN|nr:DnaJ domain-containing protein [Sphingomonas glaciei]UUR07095.1 DnaJ domain-containing protein [Sphingomonas glaciei]